MTVPAMGKFVLILHHYTCIENLDSHVTEPFKLSLNFNSFRVKFVRLFLACVCAELMTVKLNAPPGCIVSSGPIGSIL